MHHRPALQLRAAAPDIRATELHDTMQKVWRIFHTSSVSPKRSFPGRARLGLDFRPRGQASFGKEIGASLKMTAASHTPKPHRWIALFLSVLVLTSCRVVEETARIPVKAVTALVPGTKASVQDLPLLQLELERYSDDYMGRTIAAIDEYARIVGTPEAH